MFLCVWKCEHVSVWIPLGSIVYAELHFIPFCFVTQRLPSLSLFMQSSLKTNTPSLPATHDYVTLWSKTVKSKLIRDLKLDISMYTAHVHHLATSLPHIVYIYTFIKISQLCLQNPGDVTETSPGMWYFTSRDLFRTIPNDILLGIEMKMKTKLLWNNLDSLSSVNNKTKNTTRFWNWFEFIWYMFKASHLLSGFLSFYHFMHKSF